ncbi:hypothetical protein [Xanthomonas sp. WHRI 7945]|nr:hypothetical protein [Xanthomonas campestris pv. campestris]
MTPDGQTASIASDGTRLAIARKALGSGAGATKIKEQIEQARAELEAAHRRQDYAKMSRACRRWRAPSKVGPRRDELDRCVCAT